MFEQEGVHIRDAEVKFFTGQARIHEEGEVLRPIMRMIQNPRDVRF
jgi:hypothetical protein